MPFIQPPVSPLPPTLDLAGKTAVVTGASAGLGLEICRQLLQCRVETLVMAVRNVAKGEKVKAMLLSERSNQQDIKIDVMALDASSYASTSSFAKEYSTRHDRLDILMLNAGISAFKRELTEDGHESTLQVNYISNVLLFFDLMPIMEATATKTGRPSRVSITGSRMYRKASLGKQELGPGQTLIGYLDSPETFGVMQPYANSKLLVALFVREVADRYGSDKIIINNFCPGMVKTGLGGELPVYMRVVVNLVQTIRARSVERGASIALHAACVAQEETHGQLLGDKALHRYIYPQRVYNITIKE